MSESTSSSKGPAKIRVAVLMGGQSSEHDVSISSGLQVLSSLDRTRYEPIPVEIRRDGTWLIGELPKARSLDSRPGRPMGKVRFKVCREMFGAIMNLWTVSDSVYLRVRW